MTGIELFLYGLLLLLYILIALFFGYGIYAFIFGAPFVPTALGYVKKMLKLAALHKSDVLIDLGSGDGRILKKASPYVRQAIGYEINPLLYWWSLWKLKKYSNATVLRSNLWHADISEADVITLYFIPDHMQQLQYKLKRELKPGSRVVSYGFTFPDWQYADNDGKVYLYIV